MRLGRLGATLGPKSRSVELRGGDERGGSRPGSGGSGGGLEKEGAVQCSVGWERCAERFPARPSSTWWGGEKEG